MVLHHFITTNATSIDIYDEETSIIGNSVKAHDFDEKKHQIQFIIKTILKDGHFLRQDRS